MLIVTNVEALAQATGYYVWGSPIAHALVQTIVSKGIVASHVAWDSTPVSVTANEAIATAAEDGRATGEAKEFLMEELLGGPRPVNDLKKAAQAAGLSWSTVRRAQTRLNITSYKTGLEGGWQWRLPEHAHLRPEDAQ